MQLKPVDMATPSNDWPGNVREMQNLINRLVIMTDNDRISLEFHKTYLAPGQTPVVEETLPMGPAITKKGT